MREFETVGERGTLPGERYDLERACRRSTGAVKQRLFTELAVDTGIRVGTGEAHS